MPARLLRRRCCKAAFLRGCLIGAGSVNPPQSDAHLEIVTPHADFAAALVELLEGLEFHPGPVRAARQPCGLSQGTGGDGRVVGPRRRAGVGAPVEEQAVMKDVRAQANRLANWDEANLGRTNAAALRQTEAIGIWRCAGCSTTSLSPCARWPLFEPNIRISIWPSWRRSRPRCFRGRRPTIDCGVWSEAAEDGRLAASCPWRSSPGPPEALW